MSRPTKEEVDEALLWVSEHAAGVCPGDADQYHEDLAAEVIALREDNKRDSANLRHSYELCHEARRQLEPSIIREGALRAELEAARALAALHAADAKKTREELARLQSVPLFIEANESFRMAVQPRYSTEAVDAAIAIYDRYCLHDMSVDEHDIGKALEAVRASREPKL